MLSKVYKLYFWFCSRLWLFLEVSQLEGTSAHLLALALIIPPEKITSCSWSMSKKSVAPNTIWIWACQPTVVGIVLPFLFHCLFFYKIFCCLPIFFSFFFFFLTPSFLLSFVLWDRIFLDGPIGHKPIVLLSCPLCVWRFKACRRVPALKFENEYIFLFS